MKYVDIAVTVIFIIALVGIYFFWGCTWDLYATVLPVLIILVSVIIGFVQNKKMKELEAPKKD